MVDNRKELTDEVLGFDFNPSLRWGNLYLGVLLGLMAWVPEMLVYSGLSFALPSLPETRSVMWYLTALGPVVGLVWGYIAAERYDGVSLKFNREYLNIYKDRVLRDQIRWEDVESVRLNMAYTIRTRQGKEFRIPMNAILREQHDVRALRNHLRRFDPPTKEPRPNLWLGWGLALGIAGVILLNVSRRPYQVFETDDPHALMTWLKILPSVLGGVFAMAGFIGATLAIQLYGNRKKPNPFIVTETGLTGKDRELKWDQVTRIRRFGSQDLQIQIYVEGQKPWLIDCSRYLGSEELRDAILAHEPVVVHPAANPASPTTAVGKIAANSWKGKMGSLVTLGLFGLFEAILAVGSIGWNWLSGRPGDPPVIGYMSALGAVLMLAILAGALYRIELTDDQVSCSWLVGPKRSIKISEFSQIEIRTVHSKDRVYDVMTVRGPKSKILIASSLDQYADLRDAILSKVPGDKVRVS